MTRDEWIKKRTEIVSRMLDNPDKYEIYPTGICFKELDKIVLPLLGQQKTVTREWVKEMIVDSCLWKDNVRDMADDMIPHLEELGIKVTDKEG